MNILLVRK